MATLLGSLAKGLLFIVSAPAGTGKTTLTERLVAEFPCVVQSLSTTTRKPRGDEVEGVHYRFVTREQFLQEVEEGQFLEYAEVYGEYYGTHKKSVEQQRLSRKHVVLVIDTQGAELVRSNSEVVSIFIAPPSMEELRKRLELRQTESQERIAERLKWAESEIKRAAEYEYFLINDDLEITYQVFRSIFVAEEHKCRYTLPKEQSHG